MINYDHLGAITSAAVAIAGGLPFTAAQSVSIHSYRLGVKDVCRCGKIGQLHLAYLNQKVVYNAVCTDLSDSSVTVDVVPRGHEHPPWVWHEEKLFGDVWSALPGEPLPWGGVCEIPDWPDKSAFMHADGTLPFAFEMDPNRTVCPCGLCRESAQPLQELEPWCFCQVCVERIAREYGVKSFLIEFSPQQWASGRGDAVNDACNLANSLFLPIGGPHLSWAVMYG